MLVAKGENQTQMKTIKMLLDGPLSFLCFICFLVLPHPHLSFISLFSSLSLEISINSFSFHLIIV